MNWQDEIRRKHETQIAMHEAAYGVPLGQLKKEPTKKQLDEALKKFEAERAQPKQEREAG